MIESDPRTAMPAMPAMPANDQLTALDATFLELEQADDSALMHIGGALLFAPFPDRETPAIEEVREQLEQRLDLLPRYRQKLDVPRTGGLSWPSWTHDERFEIEAHVRHATLSSPGGEREFLDWISDFYSHRLDRSRPLWEMVLLDGLADGRWALVYKTHHCLVDGVGSVDLVGLLLGADPALRAPSASPAAGGLGSGGTWHEWPPHPPAPVSLVAGASLAATRAGIHALTHPRESLERSRGVIDLLLRDELIAAPPSSLNVPIGATRRIETVHVQLQELQDVRSALGGTVNDVVLGAATGALRELLLARGEDPPRRGLRAMVPVNIRREGDHGELGNQVSSLFVDLPVAEADPLRRYELLRATTEKLKASGQALAASALTGLTELAPPVLHASLARALFAKRLFNVTITNVPGSPSRVSAFGADLVDVVPIVPLAADHALGMAVVSYAGGMTFGLYADRATVPDLDVLKAGIVTSLLELTALARAPAAVA
jgi:diacylglycerol O-acyltransferase / wax synthase